MNRSSPQDSAGPRGASAAESPASRQAGAGSPAAGDGAAAGAPGSPPGPVGESPAKTAPKKKKKKKSRSFWKELPILIVVALILTLVIKTYFIQAFFIPSGSMQNTLAIGDRVAAMLGQSERTGLTPLAVAEDTVSHRLGRPIALLT